MSDYKLRADAGVIRLADGASIPPDPRNADWRDYLAWVAAGNTADPADPARPVPKMIDGNAWLDRFTGAELVALFTLSRTNAQVQIFLHQLAMGKDIVLDDGTGHVPPRLNAGLDRLVTAGVLTPQRKADLLALP